jgi:hypothetical protein
MWEGGSGGVTRLCGRGSLLCGKVVSGRMTRGWGDLVMWEGGEWRGDSVMWEGGEWRGDSVMWEGGEWRGDSGMWEGE